MTLQFEHVALFLGLFTIPHCLIAAFWLLLCFAANHLLWWLAVGRFWGCLCARPSGRCLLRWGVERFSLLAKAQGVVDDGDPQNSDRCAHSVASMGLYRLWCLLRASTSAGAKGFGRIQWLQSFWQSAVTKAFYCTWCTSGVSGFGGLLRVGNAYSGCQGLKPHLAATRGLDCQRLLRAYQTARERTKHNLLRAHLYPMPSFENTFLGIVQWWAEILGTFFHFVQIPAIAHAGAFGRLRPSMPSFLRAAWLVQQ